jgi:hypothetical protein
MTTVDSTPPVGPGTVARVAVVIGSTRPSLVSSYAGFIFVFPEQILDLKALMHSYLTPIKAIDAALVEAIEDSQ